MLNNLYELELKEENINIADIDEIASWAKTAVKNVVSNGIMNGYSDGTFGGKKRITRSEGVVALHNISNSNISVSKKASENQEEIEKQLSEENKEEQTPSMSQGGSSSTGSIGGSSGGSGGGAASQAEEQKVNENLQKALSTFNNRVAPKYSTDNQKQAGAIISESIEKYLNDSNYDISLDVQRAKDVAKSMTQEEKKEFELITTGNMDIGLLIELNKTFNIVNF